ncbi:MAG: hypothetical protein ABI377_01480, partial [Devosia sp.]
PIHILVGDAVMAKGAAFVELRAAHETAIAALQQRAPVDEAVAACKAIAGAVDPRLVGFYDLLGTRTEDFSG